MAIWLGGAHVGSAASRLHVHVGPLRFCRAAATSIEHIPQLLRSNRNGARGISWQPELRCRATLPKTCQKQAECII